MYALVTRQRVEHSAHVVTYRQQVRTRPIDNRYKTINLYHLYSTEICAVKLNSLRRTFILLGINDVFV